MIEQEISIITELSDERLSLKHLVTYYDVWLEEESAPFLE